MNYYAHRDGDRVRVTYGDDVDPISKRPVEGHTMMRMQQMQASLLAVDLLKAIAPNQAGGLPILVTCPRCMDGLVTILYVPGSPGRHTMSNGDPGYPPEPDAIEGLVTTCNCWPDEVQEKMFGGGITPLYTLFESLVHAWYAIGNHLQDELMATAEAEFDEESIFQEEPKRWTV